ncbi:MAG: trigger factor [Eubacteriaceae bacterium]|jgi:trigger factor|nr:trigger factor [Eubacteriaceae bacterium]
MAFEIEEIEKSVATLTMEIPKADFERGVQLAYQQQKNRFSIPGFRLGKAPRNLIEKRYGKEIFYEGAIDAVFADIFSKCLEESELTVVAQPKFLSYEINGDDGATVKLELALKPEFELCEYKAIPIGPLSYEPTEEDIEAEISKQLEKNARQIVIEDGAAEDGDTVTISYEGYKDGVAFEGGKAENYSLKLGSGSFIPGFEDQVVGHKPGDEFEISLAFPQDYGSAELAGANAVFKVAMHDAKRTQLPEADDDFAVDIGYESAADMRERIASDVKETKEKALALAAKEYLIRYLAKNIPMDIAPKQVSEQAANVKDRYEMRLMQQGFKVEEYYQMMASYNPDYNTGYFINMFLATADSEIRNDLIMQALVKELSIEVSEEELLPKFEEYAREYNYTMEEFKEKKLDETMKEYAESEVQNDKVFAYLLSVSDTDNPPAPLESEPAGSLEEAEHDALSQDAETSQADEDSQSARP